ncbi:MAG: hypothetical protein M3O22_07950 [Pseudomonadota bacterium]|nr:hypothetical protein [Pseudomonadota bacterium]
MDTRLPEELLKRPAYWLAQARREMERDDPRAAKSSLGLMDRALDDSAKIGTIVEAEILKTSDADVDAFRADVLKAIPAQWLTEARRGMERGDPQSARSSLVFVNLALEDLRQANVPFTQAEILKTSDADLAAFRANVANGVAATKTPQKTAAQEASETAGPRIMIPTP